MSDNLGSNVNTANKVRVSYDVTEAIFASQFIVTSGSDDIIVNFSSGHISDPTNGESILPINSRIALSTSGAQRLIATLQQALNKQLQQTGHGTDARFPDPQIKIDN